MEKMRTLCLALAVALVTAACSDDGPCHDVDADVDAGVVDHGNWAPQDCIDWIGAFCARLYYCNDLDDLIARGWPGSSDDCRIKLYIDDKCELSTVADLCDDGEIADYDTSQACTNGVRDISCTKFNNEHDYGVPACDAICKPL